MSRTQLIGALGALFLSFGLQAPAHADVVRDLATLIETRGTDPLGFIRGLRRLGDVDLREADIQRALSLLPRDVQTNADVRRMVDPVTRIRTSGSHIAIDRRNAPTLGFGNRAVKLERQIRLRVRSNGSDVVISDIQGIRAGSPNSLYKLRRVTFTQDGGQPVARVQVVLNEFLNLTHTVTIPLETTAATAAVAAPDPMQDGLDPALLREVQGMLAALGYTVTVDGEWGPQTEGAVREFQTAEEIEVDGQVGPQTLRHLRAAVARQNGRRGGLTGGLED